jgi:putative toxin-antitoxin system antitoxin component (TIGR02293 family)
MQTLISNIAQEDYLGFWRQPGELPNYRAVTDFLQIDKEETAKIARIAISSVRYDRKIPQELADRLEEIANIANRVAALFDGDVQKTALWFRTPNPMLGDVSPRDMLRMNRYRRLAKFVTEAEQGRRG